MQFHQFSCTTDVWALSCRNRANVGSNKPCQAGWQRNCSNLGTGVVDFFVCRWQYNGRHPRGLARFTPKVVLGTACCYTVGASMVALAADPAVSHCCALWVLLRAVLRAIRRGRFAGQQLCDLSNPIAATPMGQSAAFFDLYNAATSSSCQSFFAVTADFGYAEGNASPLRCDRACYGQRTKRSRHFLPPPDRCKEAYKAVGLPGAAILDHASVACFCPVVLSDSIMRRYRRPELLSRCRRVVSDGLLLLRHSSGSSSQRLRPSFWFHMHMLQSRRVFQSGWLLLQLLSLRGGMLEHVCLFSRLSHRGAIRRHLRHVPLNSRAWDVLLFQLQCWLYEDGTIGHKLQRACCHWPDLQPQSLFQSCSSERRRQHMR